MGLGRRPPFDRGLIRPFFPPIYHRERRAMATPIGGPPVQDVPPPGGYPKIFYKERLAPRGPPSWAIWGGTILVVAYGFFQVGRTNTERRYWADKKREQKLALIPLLQADEDLCWIGRYRKALAEEAEIMKHVPGWKAGESVYKTKVTWIPPSVSAFPNKDE